MQLAMQLRRLELQKRARMADAKGGRMDGVEGEEEKSKKQGGASGKGKERSRTSGAKGEIVSTFIHLQRCCMLIADAFPGWQLEKGHDQRARRQRLPEDTVEGKNLWQRKQASVAQQAQNSDIGSEYWHYKRHLDWILMALIA
jgi:hypothetical protein